MWFVVGLGNPGSRYSETRHNVGWLVVDRLAARWGVSLSERRAGAALGLGRFAGEQAALIEPLTYMNRSGSAVRSLMDDYGVGTDRLVVLHDDLDLDFGRLRLKRGGGAGGHNGLKSLDAHLPDRDYARVRFGVGRPPEGIEPVEYVLARWSEDERRALPALVERAADAAEAILREGLVAAQNQFNTRKKPTTPKPPPEPLSADGQ